MDNRRLLWHRVAASLLLVLQLAVMIYFGASKRFLHVDEWFTYTLSNGHFKPFLHSNNDHLNTKLDKAYFLDDTTVQGDERFSYDSVYYNAMKDIHPPLYFVLMHTISSFVLDSESKWIGIGLNLAFFLLNNLLLYLIARRLLGNRWLTLIPCAIWGFSAGAISAVVFIRMYEMLTFSVLASVYIYLGIRDGKPTRWQLLQLFGVHLFGFLTQYYFIIFAFFLWAAYAAPLLRRRQFKAVFLHAGAAAAGILAGVLVFPSSLLQISRSGRGQEAFTNFLNIHGYLKDIQTNFNILSKEMFHGSLAALLAILAVLLLGFYGYRYIKNRSLMQKSDAAPAARDMRWALVAVPVLCYILMVAKIAPYKADRYIFCVFPLVMLLFFLLARHAMGLYIKNQKLVCGIVMGLFLVLTALSYPNDITYLYLKNKSTAEVQAYERAYGKYDCYYLFKDHQVISQLMLGSRQMVLHEHAVILSLEDGLTKLDEMLNKGESGPVVLYIGQYKRWNAKDVLQQILAQTRYDEAVKILDAGEGTATEGYLLR